MVTKPNKKNDLQEVVGKLWGARWKILLFQALVVAVCAGVILLWPRSYRSEARLFLQLGRETVGIDPTAATGQMISVQQSSREDDIASAIDVLKGRGMIGKVVTKLTPEVVLGYVKTGKGKSSPVADKVKAALASVVEAVRQIDPMSDFERAVNDIEKNMVVRAERKSEVILIEYESLTPQLAQLVVDEFVNTYKEEHVRLHSTQGSRSFFDEQQELLQNELEAANEALRNAKNRMGLASIVGQREILESRAREVSQSLSDTERSLFEVEAKLQKLSKDISEVPARVASALVQKPNNQTDMQAQQLYTLQLTEMEYKSKYAPDHPKLIALREQVAKAEAQHKKQSTKQAESTNDINPIHRELSLEYLKTEATKAGLNKKLETLKQQKQEIVEEIRAVNGFEVEISDLERELRLREKKYISYSESLEQARINHELESNKISSVNVAQEATLQEKPVSPSKLIVLLCGFMAIGAGTAGIGLMTTKLDDRLTTATAIRNRLGVPVLATLPKSRDLAKVKVQA